MTPSRGLVLIVYINIIIQHETSLSSYFLWAFDRNSEMVYSIIGVP
jgi:hypothetical protein